MDRRLELDGLFREVVANVYFQPPGNVTLVYPCIVYELDQIETLYACDRPYTSNYRYTVTVIDRDPESPITKKLTALPLCHHDRHFVSDNLHHDVFTIY